MACTEGDRPYLVCILPKGQPLHYKFESATASEIFRFRSTDGLSDLVFGIRADLAEWFMPGKSDKQFQKNQRWLQETFS